MHNVRYMFSIASNAMALYCGALVNLLNLLKTPSLETSP
jgi:hypothetical protein